MAAQLCWSVLGRPGSTLFLTALVVEIQADCRERLDRADPAVLADGAALPERAVVPAEVAERERGGGAVGASAVADGAFCRRGEDCLRFSRGGGGGEVGGRRLACSSCSWRDWDSIWACNVARAAAVTEGAGCCPGRGRGSRLAGPGFSSMPTSSGAGIRESGVYRLVACHNSGMYDVGRCGGAPRPANWHLLGGTPLASPGVWLSEEEVGR
jgi:hypothetical protein